ncbi:MAG: hypothetical protein RL254_1870, partial [Planctomycetota bacterium]
MAHTFKFSTTIARLAILPMVALLAAQQPPAPPAKAPAPGNAAPTATPQGTDPVAQPNKPNVAEFFGTERQVPPALINREPNKAPLVATPQVAAAPVDVRQAIKFEPEILNLGEMSADVAKTGKIKVTNILDKPVKISKIVPGCGCTTTTAPPGEIAPGASADIDITLKPGAKAGIQMTKMVTFQIEGHAPQMLTVKGDVKAYITISQDMLDGPTSPDAPPMVVKLVSVENAPFKITSVLPDVLVSMPTESSVSHEVSIDWKKWEATGSS